MLVFFRSTASAERAAHQRQMILAIGNPGRTLAVIRDDDEVAIGAVDLLHALDELHVKVFAKPVHAERLRAVVVRYFD